MQPQVHADMQHTSLPELYALRAMDPVGSYTNPGAVMGYAMSQISGPCTDIHPVFSSLILRQIPNTMLLLHAGTCSWQQCSMHAMYADSWRACILGTCERG